MENLYTVTSLPDTLASHADLMRRVAYNVCKDLQLTGDIAQSAYITCAERIGTFDSTIAPLSKWIAHQTLWTARSIIRDHRRIIGKTTSARAVLASLLAVAGSDRDRARSIASAWRKLSASDRAIIGKAFAKALPARMDAKTQKRLHRARAKFSALIAE